MLLDMNNVMGLAFTYPMIVFWGDNELSHLIVPLIHLYQVHMKYNEIDFKVNEGNFLK